MVGFNDFSSALIQEISARSNCKFDLSSLRICIPLVQCFEINLPLFDICNVVLPIVGFVILLCFLLPFWQTPNSL